MKDVISADELVDKCIKNAELDEAVITHYIHAKNHNEGFEYLNEEELLVLSDVALQQSLFEVEKIPFPTPTNYTFKFIDLFAGVGGFRIALQNVGGYCAYTSEWNKDAKITYKANFGQLPYGDITKEETKSYIPEDFDILCAGFPCQAFSIAGYQKGFHDTRGTLFFDIEKVVETRRPKVVFLENVKNLVSHDNGNTFKIIIEILEEKLGYKAYSKVLNSATHANVPQNRERIFIVAFDPDQVPNHIEFKFPSEIPLTNKIHNIIDKKKQPDEYYYKEDHKYYSQLKETIKSKDTVYQWRRVYVRENKSNMCPTLTANMGGGGHNVPLILDDYGIRKLTPKECFAFQGYPVDSYILPNIAKSKLYTQAGNSVTVPLIERIAENIVRLL